MIAYVDGKPRTFTLVDGVRVWDDPSGMYLAAPPEGDGRRNNGGNTSAAFLNSRRNKREDTR